MMLGIVVILFGSTICYRPGLAQVSARAGAAASANANAISTGSSPSADAYSYAYSYPSYTNGVRDCTYNRCTPTCSVRFPQNCPQNSNPCNCPPGTVISQEGGQCVQEQQCQRYINCKGDYNASYTDCPIACPSTCARPTAQYSNTQCGTPGCECNPGYILSSINGKCIKSEDCPGGNVCRQNEIFVSCLVECPDLYCPVNEIRTACGPARPCPSGCACKYNYLRKSVNDHTCVLASECPPGICSRPNEEWNRCVSRCFSDSCKYRNRSSVQENCPFSPSECIPRCICKKNFFRNERNICVPVQECPSDTQ